MTTEEKLRLKEEQEAAALKLEEDSKYKLFSSNGSEDQNHVKDKLSFVNNIDGKQTPSKVSYNEDNMLAKNSLV